jgi:hypothetical protein
MLDATNATSESKIVNSLRRSEWHSNANHARPICEPASRLSARRPLKTEPYPLTSRADEKRLNNVLVSAKANPGWMYPGHPPFIVVVPERSEGSPHFAFASSLNGRVHLLWLRAKSGIDCSPPGGDEEGRESQRRRRDPTAETVEPRPRSHRHSGRAAMLRRAMPHSRG